MFYLDKILEVIIVASVNILLVFLGRAIYNIFRKDRDFTSPKILVYFGIGAGLFGTLFFFYGAIIGLSRASLYLFLSIFIIISILSLVCSWKDFLAFYKTLRIKNLTLLEKLFASFLILIVLYNIYRGLWPDIDFDSTWYHLTEPKIYLMNEKISYIKGGLLYYSAMPQLIESFYLLGLSIKSGITAKLFHTFFGIWCAVLAYVWGKDLGKSKLAGLISALLFYASNIVLWESQNAYIDLGVTFFVSLALWQFVHSLQSKVSRMPNLFLTSIFLGFSLGTKLLSIYWVFIILVANIIWLIISKQFKWRTFFVESLILGGIPFAMWLPWGMYSYLSTNNPVYPLAEGFFNDNDWFSATQMEGQTTKSWLIERLKKFVRFPVTIIHDEYEFNPMLIYGFFFSALSLLHKSLYRLLE